MDKSPSEYFPFGQEGERLKIYVGQQLHGRETRKNQEILKQFQREAEARRHHYRRFHRFSEASQPHQLERVRYHTLQPAHLENHTLNSNLALLRNPKMRYPLVPAEKKKPPIYRYSQAGQRIHPNYASIPVSIYQKTPDFSQEIARHQLQRTRDFQQRPQSNKHRNWALKKIKQSAFKIREKQDVNRNGEQSDGQGLITELQSLQKREKRENDELNRRLRKLKKYRMYIKQHEAHRK